MEYALKAEDIIGKSAVSEDDNTNKSQNDYGGDWVDGDCDKKSDGEDNSDGDTKRDDGCDAADGNSCDAKVTNNHVGAVIDDKIDDGYDDGDGNSSHNSSSGDKGSTHGGISHYGNSHQNINQIVLHANEMQ